MLADAYFAVPSIRSRPLVSRIVILMLQGYKRFLSPLLGSRCRFHPSCSDYARIAVARFGALRGSWLGLLRIARCQPLSAGGLDPVPETFAWWPARHDGSLERR
jgi:putative membrane protein insertion efficiency factor